MNSDRSNPREPPPTASENAVRLGALIHSGRLERRWSLQDLATASGVSVATISLVERARVGVTLAMVEKILGAMGLALHLEAEPMWAGIDTAISDTAGRPLADRMADWKIELTSFVSWFAQFPCPYMADGLMAAALQGAPVPVTAFQIAVADDDDTLDELIFLLNDMKAQQWMAKWADWVGYSNDPRDSETQPARYRCIHGELHVRLVKSLSPTLWVQLDQLPTGDYPPRSRLREIPVLSEVRLPVAPLTEIETEGRHARRILVRMRARTSARPDR
ncbi:helix-turn-helix domain-containing protein [Actinoallomurus purpureus]|uniref:helix-turn-helix domain-containing protein n=1 Tax=Actinoallomurus purpureus TaxID=478114 RepID=UPI0020935974|nr:helix-turn-helix domain-containing protein [Actinoallomurus purpureus]MCO6008660.1 helix-turn-helix domain-containing protein [Actinoallomurus purpureus]